MRAASLHPVDRHGRAWPLWPTLFAAALLLGAGLRVFLFLQQRNLWVDECMLALGVIRNTVPMITGALPYAQQAGLGYVSLLKLSSVLFGTSELALRLPALLMSTGTLALLFIAMRSLRLRPGIILLVLLMAAVNPLDLTYANDVKQYSTDAFLALALITVYLSRYRDRIAVMLPLLVVGIFTSHPFIFTATAVLAAYAWEHRSLRNARFLLYAGVTAAAFALNYVIFIGPGVETLLAHRYIRAYHAGGFAPLQFWEAATWSWYVGKAADIFHQGFGFRWMIFGMLFLLLGVAGLAARKKHALAAALTLPLLFAFAASSLQLYSTLPRLLLFSFPLLMLCMAVGADFLWQAFNRRFPATVILLVFAYVSLLHPATTVGRRLVQAGDMGTREEVGTALQTCLEQRASGETLYIPWNIYPNIYYYQHRAQVTLDVRMDPWYFPRGPQTVELFAAQVAQAVGTRGWTIVSRYRVFGRELPDALRRRGYDVTEYVTDDDSAAAYHLVRRGAR